MHACLLHDVGVPLGVESSPWAAGTFSTPAACLGISDNRASILPQQDSRTMGERQSNFKWGSAVLLLLLAAAVSVQGKQHILKRFGVTRLCPVKPIGWPTHHCSSPPHAACRCHQGTMERMMVEMHEMHVSR